MRISRKLLLYLLIPLLTCSVYGEFIVSREDIISGIKSSARFSENTVQKDKQAKYLNSLNIESVLEDTLPNSVDFETRQLARRILARPVDVWIADPEITLLIFKKSAMEVILFAEQVNRIEPFDQNEKAKMIKDIDRLAFGMGKVLKSKLGKLISEELIDLKVNEFQNRLKREIDDQMTYRMKKPFGEGDVDHYLFVFEGRLEKTIEQGQSRLKNVSDSGGSKSGYDIVCVQIIGEIIQPVQKAVHKATSIEELAGLDPDSIVSGYNNTIQRIERKRQDVFRLKREENCRKYEDQQRATDLVLSVDMQSVLQQAMKDLNIDEAVVTNNNHSIEHTNVDGHTIVEPPTPPATEQEITQTTEIDKAGKSRNIAIAFVLAFGIIILFVRVFRKHQK